MTDSDSASRQLRVIRSLMERATIYRSHFRSHRAGRRPAQPRRICHRLLCQAPPPSSAFSHRISHRLARHPRADRPDEYRSFSRAARPGAANSFSRSGMKCAFPSLAPAFFSAGVLTVLFSHRPIDLALIWITLYGIGLLATQHFAPRSLVVLGVDFLSHRLRAAALRGNISSCRTRTLSPPRWLFPASWPRPSADFIWPTPPRSGPWARSRTSRYHPRPRPENV